MSLFLDQKYLTLISNRLPLFKRKGSSYNCRCILCGDSVKKLNKARGYFYPNKDKLMYKCFNCDASMYFSTFLKNLDQNLFNQYNFESYAESKPYSNTKPEIVFEQPQFKKSEERLLDKLLERVDNLPDTHEAVQFCVKRKIPKEKFNKIYFIDNIKNIVQLNDKYKASILTEEPRIVFPFYDENGLLTAVTCRAIRGEALRYITVKVAEDKPLIYGLDAVDKNNDVFVVEGPIDSLFLQNSIAIAGTSLGKISLSTLVKENLVVVFDNQPRNREVCKIIHKTIKNGYKVVVWPQIINEKDINDMILAGRDVSSIVKKNIYSGLEAEVKFAAWKRI
jgi:DNA primase